MPLLTRRRPLHQHHQSPLPIILSTRDEPNAANGTSFRRRRVKRNSSRISMRRHCKSITLILVFLVGITWILAKHRTSIRWMYQNRYLYTNCPEARVWLRQPFDDYSSITQNNMPHLLYLTAKFGPHKDTFADAIDKQVQGAKRLGVLPETAEIVSYTSLPEELTNDPTWKLHVDSLHGRIQGQPFPGRGGGYWFWKPLLLKRHLDSLQDGDFLIYSDSDMLDFFSWLPLLLETMVEWNSNLALYQLPYLEQEWTKRDVYQEFCPSRDLERDSSGQYAGGHLILRKDNATLGLIEDWIDVMKNWHWVSDEPSTIPNLPQFQEHRHDQSLLSLLLKCKYGEPHKRTFPWTCLQTWVLTTFRIE